LLEEEKMAWEEMSRKGFGIGGGDGEKEGVES
jgi:hypothetical protein